MAQPLELVAASFLAGKLKSDFGWRAVRSGSDHCGKSLKSINLFRISSIDSYFSTIKHFTEKQ